MNRHLDSLEHSHRESEANIQMLSNQVADLGTRGTTADGRIREAEEKMKVDEQTVRDLAGRIALLPTAEDLASVRREINDKVNLWLLLLLLIFDVRNASLVHQYFSPCLRFVTICNEV